MPVTRNNNQDEEIKIPRNTQKQMDILDSRMDDLYKDIYISRTDNKNNISGLIDKIDASIDRLQANNMTVSGMSELLRRQNQKSGNGLSKASNDLIASVEDLFNDQSLVTNLFMNSDIHKYIAGQNYQYDMICKYLPKLLIALELKRDNVLFSDSFSKKFLNPKSVKTSEEEVAIFAANTKRLDNKYELDEFLDKTYMNTSIYGEDFIYIVPYREAFARLLKRSNYRRNSARLGTVSFYETSSIAKAGRKMLDSDMVTCVGESFMDSSEYKEFLGSVKQSFPIDSTENLKFKGFPVNLHFNNTNVVLDAVNEYTIVEDKRKLEQFMSIYEDNTSIPSNINMKTDASKLDSVFANLNRKNSSKNNVYSADGLIVPGDVDRDPDKLDKDFTGAVLERLPRENVIPIYIGEKQCLGYYYLDFKKDETACGYCGGHHIIPGISNSAAYSYEMSQNQQELAIRFIASRISTAIDTHFINANKDLKEEIYAVLRYNEKFDIGRANDICVSFIPAEDIVHCYFDLDHHTHRGISDLQKSVIPAMLYILLSLTDTIGKITRGVDRRIYYVKQNVEQNVAKTMMNVVQQIKKGSRKAFAQRIQ